MLKRISLTAILLLVASGAYAAQQSSYATKATPVANDKVLITDSEASWATKNVPFSAFGNVVGPVSATDNAIPVYDGTTGKLLKASGWTIDPVTGVLASNAPDGSRRSIIPNNTSIAPLADGSEEFYNEGGQIKVVESDTEYDLMHSGDVKAKYVSGTEADFYGTLLDPQAIYVVDGTNHAVTLINDVPAAFTITEISVSCDADPTTETTLTFQHKAAGVGYGTPTTIEAVLTVNGTATITSGIDDATIPAGTKVFMTLSDPDDALNECSWQIEGDWD